MISIVLIGLSLAMDAFAISISYGLANRDFRLRHALTMSLYFGAFQFLMPLLGCFLAGTVSGYISRFGPYISCGLLAFIGVRMIVESCKKSEEEEEEAMVAAEEEEEAGEERERLEFLREPPPTGTSRRVPPWVQ